MKNADLYCFALSCLLIGWLMRRNRHQEIDPVMRLRMIGAL